MDVKNEINYERVLERLQKRSFIHDLPDDLKKEIIRDIFLEINTTVLVKKIQALGYKVQYSQIAKIKRALGPIWLHLNASDGFFSDFENNILPKLKKLETLINRHYENIVDYFDRETEEKNTLELRGSLMNVGIGAPEYKKLLKDYYDDEISDEDRAFLLSFSSAKKPTNAMETKLKSFFSLVEDYVKLKSILKKSQDDMKDENFQTGLAKIPSFIAAANKKSAKEKEETTELDINKMKEMLRNHEESTEEKENLEEDQEI